MDRLASRPGRYTNDDVFWGRDTPAYWGEELTQWLPGQPYPQELVSDTTCVIGGKIEHTIPEKPLLHVCCNRDHFGDVNVDIDPNVEPDIVADVLQGLPFEDNEFAASFADFPWVESWRWNHKPAIRELLRVAPVAYVISPFLYGWKGCIPTSIMVSRRPGINHPILFVRYVRSEKYEKNA